MVARDDVYTPILNEEHILEPQNPQNHKVDGFCFFCWVMK